MNKTLQDRLVKELRLREVSDMEAGNAFLPEFIEDYNRRFARAPRNPHDAHRRLRTDENLTAIFTWQEERKLTRNLTVHFKRVTYLVKPGPDTLPLAESACRSTRPRMVASHSNAKDEPCRSRSSTRILTSPRAQRKLRQELRQEQPGEEHGRDGGGEEAQEANDSLIRFTVCPLFAFLPH
jgi:hypothetical protein